MKTYFDSVSKTSLLNEIASSWVGTPFQAKGAVKGPNGGVSCMGLIYSIAIETGVIESSEFDIPEGPVSWHRHNELSLLDEFFRSKKVRGRIKRLEPEEGFLVGDLLTLKVHKAEHHLTQLISETHLIHCHRKKGVLITSLKDVEKYVKGIYRITR